MPRPAPTRVRLEFDPRLNRMSAGKPLHEGLSAAVQVGDSLWIANDESIAVERLTRQPDAKRFADHRQFPLADYLRLPVPPDEDEIEEADIEGLDAAGGYLWLVGSHSFKRKKVRQKDDPDESRTRLAEVTADGNRFLLARIPLSGGGLRKKAGSKHAAQLAGGAKGNALTKALRDDAHLGPFLRARIPGKDNGFDIEGLAVAGDRVFLGLRGPVLRGWAVVLELAVKQDAREPHRLKLKKIGPEGRPYRKHFLDLRGLGVRDLCVHGPDLLILAGPSMDLDGPLAVFRWAGGASPESECVAPEPALPRVLELPHADNSDRAEGLTLFAPRGGTAASLLVVYDAASASRRHGSAVDADVFPLV